MAQAVSCCANVKPTQKIMQQMHGIIQYMFDCWADPVVYLVLLKSFMILAMEGGRSAICATAIVLFQNFVFHIPKLM